jgi:hypothetical protein
MVVNKKLAFCISLFILSVGNSNRVEVCYGYKEEGRSKEESSTEEEGRSKEESSTEKESHSKKESGCKEEDYRQARIVTR